MRSLYRTIILLSLFACPAIAIAADAPTASNASVMLGDITDTRTTGQFFAGLRLELKLSGDGVFEAYGIGKPEFTLAQDDTGRSLLREDKRNMLWELQARKQKIANETVMGDLNSPSRKATSFSVQGTIPVYTPSLDASAVVTIADIHSVYGQVLESKPTQISLTVLDTEALQARGRAFQEQQKTQTLPAPVNMRDAGIGGLLSSNDLQFRVKDPNRYLVKLEVIGADGNVLESRNRSKTTLNDEDIYTNSYPAPIAKGTSLKIYYATSKSMTRVPFSFENIPLP